jgi:hypothetical protein
MAVRPFILCVAFWLTTAGAVEGRPGQATAAAGGTAAPPIVIQSFRDDLSRACSAKPDLHLGVERDTAIAGQNVLVVEYPLPARDPAARDIQCVAENTNWSAGRAIAFQIKPDRAMRLSLSFFDRNRVAYTAWRELKGGVWQSIEVPFDEIRPNPFFQRPDARTGTSIDVSEVSRILFAPQDQASGRFLIGPLVVSSDAR